MSWVLILNSPLNAKPPAVIGGYRTREDAERAGDLATAFGAGDANQPKWVNYVVIPGAAVDGPAGSTHSEVVRSDDLTHWERITWRFPKEG